MAPRNDHSSAPSLTLRVTGPTARWLGLVTRTVREAALVHGRWLRVTITRVLPRLHIGLLGLRPGGLSSNPNREGGSDSTRSMAPRNDHSSAPSFTHRVTGPVARWLRMTITRALPRLHFGLLGLWPGGLSSNPNREGGSVSTRLMASHDAHSSAPSFTLRVTGVSASCGLPGEISVRLGIRGTTIKTPATTPRAMAYAQI